MGSLRLEGPPGKVLWKKAPLLCMDGGRTYMHASLQEHTCAVQRSSTSLEEFRTIALKCEILEGGMRAFFE